jgi:hypothetical protein
MSAASLERMSTGFANVCAIPAHKAHSDCCGIGNGVSHEKFVKCTLPLNQVGRYVRLISGTLTGVLKVSNDQSVSHSSVFFGTLLNSTPVSWSGTWISRLTLDHDPSRMTGNCRGLIAPRFGQYSLPRIAAPKGLIILELCSAVPSPGRSPSANPSTPGTLWALRLSEIEGLPISA